MPKVIFSEKARIRMRQYAEHYADYFLDMYDDTGIWSEEIIRDQYCKEGVHRIDGISDTITDRLTSDSVIGNTGNSSVTIPWRQKNLHVTWYDFGNNIRIVETLEIL